MSCHVLHVGLGEGVRLPNPAKRPRCIDGFSGGQLKLEVGVRLVGFRAPYWTAHASMTFWGTGPIS